MTAIPALGDFIGNVVVPGRRACHRGRRSTTPATPFFNDLLVASREDEGPYGQQYRLEPQ